MSVRPVLLVSLLVLVGGWTSPGSTQEAAAGRLSVEEMFQIQGVSSPVISPDGRQVAYVVSTTDLEGNSNSSRVWMVPLVGGEARPMTAADGSAGSPRFRPDGRLLSFVASRGDEARSQVWGLDLRGGEARPITSVPQGVSAYEWSPDSQRLALLVRDEEPERDDDAPRPPWVIDRLQFKRDYTGYLDRRRSHVYLWDIASERLEQLTSGDHDDAGLTWAPDGSRVAFVSNRTPEPDANYDTDVWVVDATPGAEPLRVSRSEGPDSAPSWSPDSQTIGWLTTARPEIHGYAMQLLAVASPGAEPRVLTEALDRSLSRPTFAADGQRITAVLESEGVQSLVEVAVADGSVRTVWGGERRVGAYARHGDQGMVAVASTTDAPPELFAIEPGGDPQRLTHHNDELIAGLELGEVRAERAIAADGTVVESFYTFPPGVQEPAGLPTILWIHGGPMGQDDWGWHGLRQLFAAHGYLVVQPNYRGSHGYGQEFATGLWQQWGGPERIDSIAAVDLAVERGWADPERLGVGGWSYGGITTNAIITHTQRFRAAVSGASASLLVAGYGHDQYQRWYEYELGLPWENRELWERLSTYNRVDQITTPTLWIGGERDWNVPIMQSELMYQAMRRLGRETLLVVYPGQHHGGFPPLYEADRYRRFLGWFGRHLTGDDSLWPE